MKTKVLMYAKNGNDLIEKSRELTPLNTFKDIYICKMDEDINEYFYIVYQFENLFFSSESARLELINNNLERIREHKDNYIENVKTVKFINSLHIEIYKRLGLDYSLLVERREDNKRQREEKDRKDKEERAEILRQAEEKRKQLLEEAFIMFKSGEQIEKAYFMELCQIKGINLHIRTKGLLNRIKEAKISPSQIYLYCNKPNKVNLDKIFEAANKLMQVS